MMIIWILLTLSVSIAGGYVYKYLIWRNKAERLTKDIAGWPTIPVIGNGHYFLGDNEFLLQKTREIADYSENNGRRMKLWLGPQLFIFTTIPEDISTINSTFLQKPAHYNFINLFVKNGLTNSSGEIWKRNIKKVHSSFTPNIVDEFQDVFNIYAKEIVSRLNEESGKGLFDAYRKHIGYVTLQAICHTILGVTNVDEHLITKEYYNAFDEISRLLMMRMRMFLYHFDFIYQLTPSFRQFQRSVKIAKGFTTQVIATKRKDMEERKRRKEPMNKVDNSNFKSLLANLIELSETDPDMNDDQIQALTDNFIGAGHETTALTSTLVFVLLGSYPQIQENVYNEMNEIFGDSNRDVTLDDLDKMTYTEAVINETLRLYPIIPLMMRQADSDLKLEGLTIPKGAACVIHAWGACRSRAVWGDDAEKFVPERWLTRERPHPAAFATFSYGKRSCIAKKYAMSILKTIISYTTRNLEIKANVTKLRLQLNISLHPIDGHQIEVLKRK